MSRQASAHSRRCSSQTRQWLWSCWAHSLVYSSQASAQSSAVCVWNSESREHIRAHWVVRSATSRQSRRQRAISSPWPAHSSAHHSPLERHQNSCLHIGPSPQSDGRVRKVTFWITRRILEVLRLIHLALRECCSDISRSFVHPAYGFLSCEYLDNGSESESSWIHHCQQKRYRYRVITAIASINAMPRRNITVAACRRPRPTTAPKNNTPKAPKRLPTRNT